MSKYSFGRQFEYTTKKSLEKLGFFVIRSAGSHGAIDILACKEEIVFAIQIKTTRSKKKHTLNQLKKEFEPLIKQELPRNFFKVLLVFYSCSSTKNYLFQLYDKQLNEINLQN